ncbi:unnamed protein product, partial [Polarella glacialis]
MQRVVAALLQALAELDTATSGAGVAVPASVALVLPTWAASQALKAATEASFCRAVLQVSGAEHCYLNGRQHCCQPKHRLLRQSEARGSSIIFLQNEAGAERWPATPERLECLRAAWVEGGFEGGAEDRELPEGRRFSEHRFAEKTHAAERRQAAAAGGGSGDTGAHVQDTKGPAADVCEVWHSSLPNGTNRVSALSGCGLVCVWAIAEYKTEAGGGGSSSSPRSPYEVLGIEKGAAAADVKRAYRKQEPWLQAETALKWHPDKCELDRAECEARFIEVAGAYEVLGDEAKRRSFDAFNSFFENFEAALSDEKLDAYVQQAFEMFGASSADKDTKDSWSVWGLKKAMKWGVKSFGQSVLEGSFAARPIHCVRLRAECCIRNGDIQISLKDDSGQSGPAGPAGKVHGNGKKSQCYTSLAFGSHLSWLRGFVKQLGAWLGQNCGREKGKRKRSVCLAWISMASAFFSLIDSLGETFEEAVGNVEDSLGNFEKEFDGALQQMDAGVDLDDVLEEIEVAGSNEVALLEAYRRLEVLARNQSPAVMQAWVVEDRVVPVVCAALCRVESARLAAGALARTLNGMGHALDITGASPEEFREFCQQIVRRTENGKAMLKLMQAQDVSSQTQGLALLRRVYPHTSAVLGRHLLSDPAAVGALMQILQDASGSAWSADGDGKGESADSQMGLASLCAECVQFLSLVTAQDGDVRMIVTFQDGAEALLAIAAQALSAANAAGTGPESSSSAERSRAFLGTAAGACACVRNLVGQGSVAQKYMREAGHMVAVTRTLRGSLILLQTSGGQAQLEAVALTLLDIVAAFVTGSGSEAAANAKQLLQGASLADLVFQEVLPAPRLSAALRLRAMEVFSDVLAAAAEPVLMCLTTASSGDTVLDTLVEMLLTGAYQAVPSEGPLRVAAEELLSCALQRSAQLREVLATALESAAASPGAAGAEPASQPTASRSGILLLSTLRAAADPARLAAAVQDSGSGLAVDCCRDPSCQEAAKAIAGSPAQLPELVALLEPQSGAIPGAVQVRGLAALVLGLCLLALPGEDSPAGSGGAPVGATRLMSIIASRIGVDAFTRAADDFQRCLAELPTAGRLQQFHAGFAAFADTRFQQVQEAMVRIWLDHGSPSSAAGAGSGADGTVSDGQPAAGVQGMAADVAEHFKAESLRLKEENSELRKLTTDEESSSDSESSTSENDSRSSRSHGHGVQQDSNTNNNNSNARSGSLSNTHHKSIRNNIHKSGSHSTANSSSKHSSTGDNSNNGISTASMSSQNNNNNSNNNNSNNNSSNPRKRASPDEEGRVRKPKRCRSSQPQLQQKQCRNQERQQQRQQRRQQRKMEELGLGTESVQDETKLASQRKEYRSRLRQKLPLDRLCPPQFAKDSELELEQDDEAPELQRTQDTMRTVSGYLPITSLFLRVARPVLPEPSLLKRRRLVICPEGGLQQESWRGVPFDECRARLQMPIPAGDVARWMRRHPIATHQVNMLLQKKFKDDSMTVSALKHGGQWLVDYFFILRRNDNTGAVCGFRTLRWEEHLGAWMLENGCVDPDGNGLGALFLSAIHMWLTHSFLTP